MMIYCTSSHPNTSLTVIKLNEMTEQELFEKYHIDESHSKWDFMIDNWMSVEIYRVMHNGELPQSKDISCKYILDFLDGFSDHEFALKIRRNYENWGSLYLTAKREVYKLSELILEELNSSQKGGGDEQK